MSVFAGIDLGGTYMKAGLASADAATIAQESWDTETHGGPDRVIDRMAGLVETRMTHTKSEDLVAVGVGMPGLVDIASGESKFSRTSQPSGEIFRWRRSFNASWIATFGC